MPTASLDARDRAAAFRALEAERFDLAVIGGGVTGAGIARDAALRGLRVALLEARDWASGTSSRSSKMIHGGLRYLAQGDIALVREAASERQILRRIAPHLARIEPFIIPVKNMAQVAKLRTGMWTFEKLGGVPASERHEVLDARALAAVAPTLKPERFSQAVRYNEFLTDDARLVVANVRDAQAAGAVVVNYAEVNELIAEGGRTEGLRVASTLPGDASEALVRAALVINAAGPWVDHVRSLDTAERAPRLHLSRGIHLVFNRSRMPTDATLILPTSDRRSVFLVPRGRFTYLGTTDTFQDELGYWPAPRRTDIDYLFREAQNALNVGVLGDDDIVSIWSGLRPLIAQADKGASEVSRKDEIWTSPSGLVSIAGGKLSAYRSMAERVVDLAVKTLGVKAHPCTTAKRLLPGGDLSSLPSWGGIGGEAARAGHVGETRSPEVTPRQPHPGLSGRPSPEGEGGGAKPHPQSYEQARLYDLYGSEAALVTADAADGLPAAEARRAVLHEGALRLEDWWVRRSLRAWFDDNAGLDAMAPAAAAMGALLGWDDARRQTEIEACRAIEQDSRAALARQKETA